MSKQAIRSVFEGDTIMEIKFSFEFDGIAHKMQRYFMLRHIPSVQGVSQPFHKTRRFY